MENERDKEIQRMSEDEDTRIKHLITAQHNCGITRNTTASLTVSKQRGLKPNNPNSPSDQVEQP